MAINSAIFTAGPYAGNDVTTEFSFTFRIENKTQIEVTSTDAAGVVSVLVVDVDYTVSGLQSNSGLITMTTAPVTGVTIDMTSDYKYTQLTEFESQGGFFPDVHERAFDKLTYLMMQTNNDNLKRTPDDGNGNTMGTDLNMDGFQILNDFAPTTESLINVSADHKVGTVVYTSGFYVASDGGHGPWLKTATTGQTPSQSPAQLLNGLFNDPEGNQWRILGFAGTSTPEINVLSMGAKYDGDEISPTDDTAAHTAGLLALSTRCGDVAVDEGSGVLRLPSGTTNANILNIYDRVGIIGEGRSSVVAPSSGIGVELSSISAGFGSHVHNFTVSGAYGCDTGMYIAGFSRGKIGDLWLIEGLDTGLHINGDGSTEFTFGYIYIGSPVSHGVKYLRTNDVDTGGVYFDTLHVTGGGTALGLEVSSTHTSRTRAFIFANKMIIDGRTSNEAILLKNVEQFFFSQVWATGTVSGKGMVTFENVKDVMIEQMAAQNSSAGGYNILFSGEGASPSNEDIMIDQLRTSGPTTEGSIFFTESPLTPPTMVRCNIGQWNDTAVEQTNDETRLAQLRSIVSQGSLTVRDKVNFAGAFKTLALSSGAITADAAIHRVQPETGTEDDLVTINGGVQGDRLIIMSSSSSNILTVKHGTGNIYLTSGADTIMTSSRDKLELVYFGSEWQEISSSKNSGQPFQSTVISADTVDYTSTSLRLLPETGTADDLATITGGTDGDTLILMSNSTSDNITIKHGTGNIYLPASLDFILNNSRDKLMLVKFGAEWQTVSKSSNS